jgi:hypothetical protein
METNQNKDGVEAARSALEAAEGERSEPAVGLNRYAVSCACPKAFPCQ